MRESALTLREQIGEVANMFKRASIQLLSLHDQIYANMAMHQNEIVSVNRLPPEILSEIFLDLAESLASREYRRERLSAVRNEWLRVTRVCRRWREVAVGQPLLWNVLDYNTGNARRQTHEAALNRQWLRRAGCAPLDICIGGTNLIDEETLAELAARCGQIRRLWIRLFDPADILSRFAGPATHLEELTIQSFIGAARLPTLVGGDTPFLKRLAMSGKALPSLLDRFSGRVHLELANQVYKERADYVAFLGMLRSSPGLESLSMCRCAAGPDIRPYVARFDGDESDVLRMPRLANLTTTLCQAPLHCAVLSRIVLVPEQKVTVKITVFQLDDVRPSQARPARAASSTNPIYGDLTSLTFDVDYSLSVRFEGPTSVGSLCCEENFQALDGEVTDLGAQVFVDLRHIFRFSSLETLRIQGKAAFLLRPWDDWCRVLGDMTSLITLEIDLHLLSDISRPPLWLNCLTDEDAEWRAYPAPHLHTLRIIPPPTDGLYSPLSVLENRHRSGHRLHRLDVIFGPKDGEQQPNWQTLMRWREDKEELLQFVDEFEYLDGPSFDHPTAREWAAYINVDIDSADDSA